MAKVLISFLGTGKKEDKGEKGEKGYKTAKYNFEGKVYEDSSISKVLVEGLKIERLFLLGTGSSIWDWVYEAFCGQDTDYYCALADKVVKKTVKDEDLIPLMQTIKESLGHNTPSWCKIIEFGKDKQELENNFDIFMEIAEKLKDKDEIYLDITHSFRSLPFMGYILLDYLQGIGKKFTLSGIYYGMYEFQNEIKPVVDLKNLYKYGQFSKAFGYFREYGNPHMLNNLLHEYFPDNKALIKNYQEISEAFSLAYMPSIKDKLNNLSLPLKKDNDLYSHINKHLQEFTNKLKAEETYEFLYNLANFYTESYNYGLAYITLQSAVEEKIKVLADYNTFDDFQIAYDNSKFVGKEKPWEEHYNLRDKIKTERNKIAHPNSDKKSKVSISEQIENLKQYLAEAKSLLFTSQN